MVDAIVGAVIMVVATTSLFLAVEVAEDGFRAAGRYPVSQDEAKLLDALSQSLLDRHQASGDAQMSREIVSGLELIENVESDVVIFLPKRYLQDDGN